MARKRRHHRHSRAYREIDPGPFDPIHPSKIGASPEFWRSEAVVAARQAHYARITKSARYPNGKLRSDLFRVRPKLLSTPEEKEAWLKFMHLECPFKEGFAHVLTGFNEGDYVFVDKADATLFKLFWG